MTVPVAVWAREASAGALGGLSVSETEERREAVRSGPSANQGVII